MVDQSKAWTQIADEFCFFIDVEQDDADNEDSDPSDRPLAALGT
jgi:hypothetical protein